MSVSEPAASQPKGLTPAQKAAAAGVVGTAAVAAAPPVAAAGLATMAGIGATAIVASLMSFLTLLREANKRWLLGSLGRYSSVPADIAQVIADEMRFEEAFAQASSDRLAAGLPAALEIADPAQRAAAVRRLLDAEERYAQQRQEAMAARAIAAVTRAQLRRDSPLGAFWRLGRALDHTSGCVVMAGGDREGAGKFWPWAVIDRVHPPRHYGCTSTLHSFGEAIHEGWMRPGDVPDTREAIRAASGVLMEEWEADALERELELRETLVEAGLVTWDELALRPWEGVAEAFTDAEHPRDWHGRWIDAFHFTSEERAAALLKGGVTPKALGGGNYGRGFYVSQHPQGKDDAYGPVGLRLRIKLDKPLVLDKAGSAVLKAVNDEVGAELDREGVSRFGREWDNRVTAKLRAKGYDGVHVPWGSPESGGHYYVVFNPRRVKVVGRHTPPDGGGSARPENAAAALKRGEPSMIKPGDAPKLIDSLNDGSMSSLHMLSVEGHPNLFRAHARELSRAQMPQVRKADLPGFMDFLRQHHVSGVIEQRRPSELRATQNQINGGAVAALAKGWDPTKGNVIMVSQAGDVLDGHHRWAAAALDELSHPERTMGVLRFSAGTDRILALMREYNELTGAQGRAFGESSKNIPMAGGA